MNVNYEDFSIICRLCLSKIDTSACMLEDNAANLLDKLGVYNKVTQYGELPQKVCSQCKKCMESIFTFLNQCKRSYLILCSIVQHTNEIKNENKNDHSLGNNYDYYRPTDNHLTSKEQEIEHEVITDGNLLGKTIKDDLEILHIGDTKKKKDGVAMINCKKCNLLFKSKMCLSTHYRKSVECRPFSFRIYKCEYCNKEFLSSRDKTEHENIHTGNTPYTCSYCIKKFKFKTNLHRHIYRHKQKLGLIENGVCIEQRVRLKLTCNICNKVFASRSGFQHHKLRHEGKVLPKKVDKKPNKNNKQFLCNYCAKGFYIKSHLDAHLRVHTGERPYKCSHCDQQFKQKSVLARHTLNHLDVRPKPFVCDICQKSFTTRAHMQIHKRLHTGEKPYQCHFCHKSFNYKTRWKMHLRIHTGDSPFTCNVCNKSYHDKGSLKKHQKKKSHISNEDLNNADKMEKQFSRS